jgi:hypothetical protein
MGDIMPVNGDDGGCINCTGFVLHEDKGVLHLHNSLPWMDFWAGTPVPGLLAILTAVLVFFLTLHLARLIGWLHGRIAERLLVRL